MLRTANPARPATIDDLIDPATIARLSGLDVASRKVFAGRLQGERRSKKRGVSVEFADHRPYAVGDDIRRIDWNIYGRLDRLFLKLFMEEEDLSLQIVLDASASSDTGEPNKYVFMQRAAMALAYVGLVNLNRVTLTVMGGRRAGGEEEEADPGATRALRDLRGRRRLHDAARFLCAYEPAGPLSFPRASERIALARTGRGVMVVLSDFLFRDGYESGLRRLAGRGYDLFCVQVLSPQEVRPTIAGDLRLRDLEDGEQAEVTISAALLKRYGAVLGAYCAGLREFGARREISVLTVPSDTPVDTLLLEYLRRRGMLA